MRLISFVGFLFLLIFASLARAQTIGGQLKNPVSTSSSISANEQVKNALKDKKETIKEKRTELKNEVEEKRKEAQEKAKTKREEYKKKLQVIKDERKKALVDKIDSKIQASNQTYIKRLAESLDKLQSLLDKLSQRIAEAKTKGADTSLADSAMLSAQTQIDKARSAVSAQASKEYVVLLPTDETGLKNAVGSTMSQFRLDIRDVHKMVIDAKQAVKKAYEQARKLKTDGIKDKEQPVDSRPEVLPR